MLLTCPHCATLFRVDADLIPANGQKVCCSICNHIWVASSRVSGAGALNQPSMFSANAHLRLKILWKMIFVIVIVVGLFNGVVVNRATLTAYVPSLINWFDFIGLTIPLSLEHIHVVGLHASYSGDTVRLSGGLHNSGSWRAHAADLHVIVRDVNDIIIQEAVIRPDRDIIAPRTESQFFVQLAVEAVSEVTVTVTPLASPVFR